MATITASKDFLYFNNKEKKKNKRKKDFKGLVHIGTAHPHLQKHKDPYLQNWESILEQNELKSNVSKPQQ